MDVVRLAYEGLSHREAWVEMLAKVRTLFGARDAWLVRIPLAADSSPFLLASGVDRRVVARYSGKMPFKSPAMTRALADRIEGVLITGEIVPWQEMERTEYYDAIRRPRGVRWEIAAARLLDSDSMRFLTAHRAPSAPQYGERERALMWILYPHVTGVLQVDDRRAGSRTREGILRTSADHAGEAILFLKPCGTVRALNDCAEALLRAERVPGKLDPAASGTGLPLLAFLYKALAFLEAFGSRETPPPVHRTELVLSLAGGRRARLWSEVRFEAGRLGGFIVVVRPERPGSPETDVDLGAWDFTPRESDIARQLIAGTETDQICGKLGITKETLKRHLQHVFQKTGARSRAQLVAQLYGAESP